MSNASLTGEYNKVADALSRRPDFSGALITEFGLADDVTCSLVEAYHEDQFMSEIICRLEAKDKVTSAEFELVNGLLFLEKAGNKRLCVPNRESLRSLFLGESHDATGHFGFKKTAANQLQRFWWPTMMRDAKLYVETCQVCQRDKPWTQAPLGLLKPLPIPERPGESLSMDFMDTVVTSKSGMRYIYVIVDRFNKYARLVAMPETAKAEYVIKLFKENWVRDFGLSEVYNQRQAYRKPLYGDCFLEVSYIYSGGRGRIEILIGASGDIILAEEFYLRSVADEEMARCMAYIYKIDPAAPLDISYVVPDVRSTSKYERMELIQEAMSPFLSYLDGRVAALLSTTGPLYCTPVRTVAFWVDVPAFGTRTSAELSALPLEELAPVLALVTVPLALVMRIVLGYRSHGQCDQDNTQLGVFVLQDNRFRWLTRISVDMPSSATIPGLSSSSFGSSEITSPRHHQPVRVMSAAGQYLYFPCGLIRGALTNLGVSCTVSAEVSSLPTCSFTIRIKS
ncbi:hypothetical protein CBR_g12958 [Chara braunii]|uniref:Integrase catalytic domain-containing protein n=1 Tax=Chara braunii TaxID=69332 RepID=A0A388KT50_CHABU|nr:hypothetical protein CBR_g12958 [Chara braunii]|eukprot:GBG73240.1 hypothetical protein CBR_g12958 [Chara braunii]